MFMFPLKNLARKGLRGLIVKSAEHCGADYKPLDNVDR